MELRFSPLGRFRRESKKRSLAGVTRCKPDVQILSRMRVNEYEHLMKRKQISKTRLRRSSQVPALSRWRAATPEQGTRKASLECADRLGPAFALREAAETDLACSR